MFKIGKIYKFYHTSCTLYLKCIKRENGTIWFEYNQNGISGTIISEIGVEHGLEYATFHTYYGLERLYADREV